MSVESSIEASGRRVFRSPLWMGLLITAFLVLPTFLVPGVPLWVALTSLVTLTPLVLGSTYLLYFLYGRFLGSDSNGNPDSLRMHRDRDRDRDRDQPETAIEQLRHEYATGKIDEVTFERRLERLLETEPQRHHTGDRETDLLTE